MLFIVPCYKRIRCANSISRVQEVKVGPGESFKSLSCNFLLLPHTSVLLAPEVCLNLVWSCVSCPVRLLYSHPPLRCRTTVPRWLRRSNWNLYQETKAIICLYIPIRRTAHVCVYVYQMRITIWHEKTSDIGPRDRDMPHVWNVKWHTWWKSHATPRRLFGSVLVLQSSVHLLHLQPALMFYVSPPVSSQHRVSHIHTIH